MQALGIPPEFYHPLRRGRVLSPTKSLEFVYPNPKGCVMDVRRVYQFLAEKAVEAGAQLRVATSAQDLITENDCVVGVRAKDFRGQAWTIRAHMVMDASGYRAAFSKKAGLHAGFTRFGVGAEYDMYAPSYDEDEVIAVVGSQIAPCGYAWTAPWGKHRVRVGVGIIHADSSADPRDYLDQFVREAAKYKINLKGAEPIEYHHGLIPSDGLSERFVGNGIMAIGDAAGQPSALLGEGIRWAIKAGRMAGEVAVEAVAKKNYSREFLSKYERQWKARHGTNLKIAHEINKKIAGWSDEKWDEWLDSVKSLTAEQFSQALESNFTASWMLQVLSANPRLIQKGAGTVMEKLRARVVATMR